MEEKETKDLKDIPVYPYPFVYARENGEAEQFRESRNADVECRKYIDALVDAEWDGMRLPAHAAKDVLEKFGAERTVHVLANTLQRKRLDGRFSQANKDWAQAVPMCVPEEGRESCLLRSHPAKLDGLVTRVRQEVDIAPIVAARAETLKAIPLYQNSMEYAMKHGESAQYAASHDASVACKEAIETAIARNYRDNCLNSSGAKQVAAQFGFERTFFVLASTVRHLEWDGRISTGNKEWAKTQPSFDTRNNLGRDMSTEYLVGNTGSPGLTNIFLDQVREEYALAQERSEISGQEHTKENPLKNAELQMEDDPNMIDGIINNGAKESSLPKMKESREQAVEQKTRKKPRTFRSVPVYLNCAELAEKRGETEQYRASHEANYACRNAIDEAIHRHFDGIHLPTTAVKSVLRQFGVERVSYVLAHTIRMKPEDGRFSSQNRQWADTVQTCEDRKPQLCVCWSHPAALDVFTNQTREEILCRTPLSRDEIQAEAQSVLTSFQQIREPNTQDGQHFALRLSDDFMKRAKRRDLERLSGMLPFKSLTLTSMPDRIKGKIAIAVIPKDEDRNQALTLRNKPSIRKQLAEKPVPAEQPPAKPRGAEAR